MARLFLFSVGAAGVLALLFALLSVPVSIIYGDALLRPMFLAGSIGVFFSTLNSVPNGVMLREKRFASIGVRLIVVNTVTGVGAIALAFLGAGTFALVAQSVASSALVFVWNLSASGVRLRRVPVLGPLRAVLGSSGFQAAHGFVNYFSRNMDNLLVGLAFGSAMLGLYNKAYGLSTYPITMFTSVVASVLHPYLSDWRDEPGRIYERFVGLAHAVFAVGILVSACCVACADELVAVMYGGQWAGSAPLFRALSVSVMFQMVTSLTGSVFQSLGDTRDMFRSAVVNTAVTLVAICVGVASGSLLVLAVLVSAAYCVNPVATFWYLGKAFGRPARDFASEFSAQLGVAAAMLAAGVCTHAGLTACVPGGALAVLLVVKVVCCFAVYAVLLVATGQWRYVSMLARRAR